MGALVSSPAGQAKMAAALQLANTIKNVLLRLESIASQSPSSVPVEIKDFLRKISLLSSFIREKCFPDFETSQLIRLLALKKQYNDGGGLLLDALTRRVDELFLNVEQRNFVRSLVLLNITGSNYQPFMVHMIQQSQLSGEGILWLCHALINCFSVCNIATISASMGTVGIGGGYIGKLSELENMLQLVTFLNRFIPAITIAQSVFSQAVRGRQAVFSNPNLATQLLAITTIPPDRLFGDTIKDVIFRGCDPNIVTSIFVGHIRTVFINTFPEHEARLNIIFDLSMPAEVRSNQCNQIISTMSTTDSARLLACLYEIRPALNSIAELLREAPIPQISNLHVGINSMIQAIETKYNESSTITQTIIQVSESHSDGYISAGLAIAGLLLGFGVYMLVRKKI